MMTLRLENLGDRFSLSISQTQSKPELTQFQDRPPFSQRRSLWLSHSDRWLCYVEEIATSFKFAISFFFNSPA
jgi:hypothetical protein